MQVSCKQITTRSVPILPLPVEQFEAFQAFVEAAPAITPPGATQPLLKTRSPLRARKILKALRAIVAYAQFCDHVAQNVTRMVKFEANKRAVAKLVVGRDIPDKEQIQQLLAAAAEPKWRRFRPLLVTPRSSPVCAPPNCAACRGVPLISTSR
jgi:hypothetical protein